MSNRVISVEVVQKRQSRANKDHVKELVHNFLSNFVQLVPGGSVPASELRASPELDAHVEAVTFCDLEDAAPASPAGAGVELRYCVHSLDERGAETDWLTAGGGGGGEDGAAAELWALPAREFHGLWESLEFDGSLKRDLVRLVERGLELAARGVDPLAVGWNRVVLLHGPPGTGKTSLCRALAHKLAVRLADRFPRARLLEVNAHGLFSKWFSESGKLVARLFERVRAVAADPRLLAVVLVDEAESLAAARRAALAAQEPADAVRAVNALLAQLDRLRRLPNVLVLASSNVTGAIDVAFADRADIKRRVGPPSPAAALRILRSCCAELAARGAVRRAGAGAGQAADGAGALAAAAREAAAAGVSGRALRRLPFLALALHVPPLATPAPTEFEAALLAALREHLRDDAAYRAEEPPAAAPAPSPAPSPALANGH